MLVAAPARNTRSSRRRSTSTRRRTADRCRSRSGCSLAREDLGQSGGVLEHDHADGLVLAPQRHLLPGHIRKGQPCVLADDGGEDELCFVLLGECLEPAGGIYRVADCGERGGMGVTYLADDG